MVLVPKGTPVHEKVAAKDLHLPTVLGMLRSGSLTGYARFIFSSSEAVLLFQEGKLSEALLEEPDRRVAGTDAVDVIFDRLAAEEGRMDVYRLAPDVATSIQALLHGEVLFEGQSLGIVDIKALLDKVKKQLFTGCLRIYTEERTALIFYKAGFPLGFFHDGAEEIETEPTASQNIAKLPGAKLDALATRSTDELVIVDLLAQVDIKQRWADACARAEQRLVRRTQEEKEARRRHREGTLAALEDELRQIVVRHLGSMGRQAFDKVLAGRIGRSVAAGADRITEDLAELEKAARLLTGASQTRQLLDEIRTKIDSWLASEPAPGPEE